MKKINAFTLKTVKMTGFKRFVETYEAEMGEITYINGGNGRGKTSIADAITFAFYGVPFWGDKGSDRLLNQNASNMQVEVSLVDGEGKMHTLVRRRSGDKTSATLDSIAVRQTDINKIFIDKEVFLSIFNPLYFIEKIAGDGREFLLKLMPPVDKQIILDGLNEVTRSLLENENLLDPGHFIEIKRKDIRELEKTNIYLNGQIDFINTQLGTADETLKEANARTDDINGQIEAFRAKHKLDAANVKELETKLAEINASVYVSKLMGELADTGARLKQFYAEYDKLKKIMGEIIPGGKCPSCTREITGDSIDEIKAELKKQMDAIVLAGKEMKSQLSELTVLDKQCEQQFTEFREADIKKYSEQLESLQSVIKELNCLETEKADLASKINNLTNVQPMRDAVEKFKTTVADNEKAIAQTEKLISAVAAYSAKRVELTVSQLKMDKAAIKLFDVVKSTGECKDAFSFTYTGRDYRWLSASEKLKTGIEVSGLIRRLTGCNYPMFIDNAECITTSLNKPDCQIIFAIARKGEFSIVCRKQTSNEEAA